MISTVNFPVLSWEQNNPSWVRAQRLMDLITGGIKNYEGLQQARYSPELTRAALEEQQAKANLQNQMADWFGPKTQSEIGLQGAQARNLFSETGEREALLPSKIREAQLKSDYPLLGLTGEAAQIGALQYMQQHPEEFGEAAQQIQSGNPSDLTIKPNQYGQLAAGVNVSGGNAQLNPQALQQTPQTRYSPIRQALGEYLGQSLEDQQRGNVAQTLGLVRPQLSQIAQSPVQMFGRQPSAQQPQTLIDMMKQGIGSAERAKTARAGYFEKQTQTADYRLLPLDQKTGLLAQAAGFGLDPTEATNAFVNGATVKDLAKQQGFGDDPSKWPDPIYAITKPELARVQQRKAALNELNILNPILTEALAPYAQRFAGWSPKQIAQSLSGDDPDAQARFLAAKALTPELSIIRVRAAQGNQVGIEAMREMMNSSMGNIKAFQFLVRPEVYTAANRYIDQWLNQSVAAANTSNARWMDKISSAQQEERINKQLPNDTKSIGGKTYIKVNGQWYEK